MQINAPSKAAWNNPLFHLISTAWRYTCDRRPAFIIYVSLSAASMAVALLDPVIIGKVLNALQASEEPQQKLQSVLFYLSIYVLNAFIFWCLHGPSRVMERNVAFWIRNNYQIDLFKKIVALPIRWHRDHHSGSTIDKVSRATTALNEFCDGGFETIHMFSRFIGAVVALCIFMPVASVGVLGGTLLVFGVIYVCDKVLIRQYHRLNGLYHQTAAAFHDYLTNITTVISLRLGELTAKEVQHRAERPYPVFRSNVILNELKWFVTTMIVTTLIAGILYWYCAAVFLEQPAILVGTAFTLFDYLRRIGESFFGFAWKYGTIVQESSRVRSAEHILHDFEKEVGELAEAALPEDWNLIEIRGLDFTHAHAREGQQHLHNINLNLERGKSLALVGESGSGKSTILSLLRALVEPDSVQVFCAGQQLPHGLRHIAHHTTLIPQNPEIFAETIRFNVGLGVETELTSIESSLERARFDSVIPWLQNGLDTNLSEKGVNLSGGEKQRLALARGIYFAEASASDILLLDEPTSSVDLANETHIYRNILSCFKDRCIVSSIHKLHLLAMFDSIVVLDKGRVVEFGTFGELMSAQGAFSRLWDHYQQEKELSFEDAS